MRRETSSRTVAMALLATAVALGPILAEARPGIRGGASTSISRGGGGGGSHAGGGGSFGGASASTRPSGGESRGGSSGARSSAGAGDRTANSGGNRVNNGNINSGNRVNNGNINTGNVNNINVDASDRRYDWDDRPYHPVAGAVAIGAVAGITAAAVGSMMYTLPSGCSPYPYGGYSYYHCGGAYYETRYEGDKVVYVVVDEPK